MIAATYALSGLLLAVAGYFFAIGVLSATGQTIAWMAQRGAAAGRSAIDTGLKRHDAEAIGAAVLGLFEMALEEIRDVWPGARARSRFSGWGVCADGTAADMRGFVIVSKTTGEASFCSAGISANSPLTPVIALPGRALSSTTCPSQAAKISSEVVCRMDAIRHSMASSSRRGS